MIEQWKKYESVKRYNSRFLDGDYYSNVKTWYDFYEGDQWNGIDSNNNLPKPIFNIVKRIDDFKVASLTADKIAVNVETLKKQYLENGEEINDVINGEIDNILEKIKFDTIIRDALTDASITGDMCMHIIFNPDVQLYKEGNVQGIIEAELIDATNVGFANPNIKDVEKQKWVCLIGRDTVENLKEEQKAMKGGHDEITPDNETNFQVSDYVEDIQGDEDGKALYIYVYEKDKKTGTIKVGKYTQDAVIYENVDTGLTHYPIAFENWYTRKNSFHGRGEVEGICPNQVYINKAMAMMQYHTMQTAFPLTMINEKYISTLSNKIGGVLKVKLDETKGEGFNNVIHNLEPVNMSQHIINITQMSMDYTKDCMGVTDASLGNIDPKNTSAIIAVQKSSAIPLENIRSNLYNFVEQIVIILIDMMSSKYGMRPVYSKVDGEYIATMFDFSQLKNIDTKLNIDIGAGSYYSEIALLQTLDNLLLNEKITTLQYLERIPDALITQKQELINDIKQQEEMAGQQNAQYEQMAQFLETLPPEQQQQIMSLPPEQQEQVIMQMMGGVQA